MEHSLISERELNDITNTMVKYIVTVGKSLHERFPEMDIIIENTSILDPSLRQLQKASIKLLTDRFHTGKELFVFDSSIIESEYAMYRNYATLDLQYQICQSIVKFWCQLYETEEYKQLASLALLLLSISPSSVMCERGFSVMNYIINEYRTLITQENLNSCMSIAMSTMTFQTFLFIGCCSEFFFVFHYIFQYDLV